MATGEMTTLEAALRRAVDILRAERLRWAIIGGLAVSARCEPRTTRDIDVAVAVSADEEAERILFRLQGHGLVVVSTVEQTARKRLATARLRGSDGALRLVLLDLLFASSGIEREVVATAEEIEVLPGLSVPVARTGYLIALKALARNDRYRPQDLDDVRSLLRDAAPEDLDEARRAAALIEFRGFARGRSLSEELETLLRGEV